VDGSGTGDIVDAPAGAPAIDGSKMKVPLAPTVKLVPLGKAVLEVAISIPALTFVPPV